MTQTSSSSGDEQPLVEKPKLGIWELAWPAILSNLLFSVIGIITIKIVGELGQTAVAAVTTGHRIFFVLSAVLMAVSAGTSALVARAWGAGDYDEAAKVTTVSVLVGSAVAVLLMIPFLTFSDEIAGVFQLDPISTAAASDYIFYLSLFSIGFAINFVLGAALRAAGDTRTPLWFGMVANIANVCLTYWLVYGGFGVPSLGAAGAGAANGLSLTLSGMLFLSLWLAGRLRVQVGRTGALEVSRLRQLVHIGYPAGLEQFVFHAGFIGFLWLVARHGTAAFAAYGVGVQVLSMSFVVGFGFSIAGATLVGQHLGARDPDGATRQGWHATFFAIGSMVTLGTIILLLAEPIARFLIDDDEVVHLTVIFIYIMAIAQPMLAIEFTLGGCLRGAGDTRFPLLTTLIGLILVRVGLAAVATYLELEVKWIYAALIADYMVKVVMLVWRFRSGRWKDIFDNSEPRPTT